MSEQESRRNRVKKLITLSTAGIFATVIVIFLINLAGTFADGSGRQSALAQGAAQETQVQTAKNVSGSQATGWGFLAAALSTGFGCLGAGIAVAYVGSAALGVIGEKPELTARALIYVGLAEGIAIYGLIIAIMILTRI